MFNRSLFVKIEKLNINTIHDSMMVTEYLEVCICYIIKKILVNNSYSSLDIRYNYSTYKIDNAFSIVENTHVNPDILQNLLSLSDTLMKYIEQVIEEFYIKNKMTISTLNMNSMLVNKDSLLLTCETFVQR
jgi:hypothetical protein